MGTTHSYFRCILIEKAKPFKNYLFSGYILDQPFVVAHLVLSATANESCTTANNLYYYFEKFPAF